MDELQSPAVPQSSSQTGAIPKVKPPVLVLQSRTITPASLDVTPPPASISSPALSPIDLGTSQADWRPTSEFMGYYEEHSGCYKTSRLVTVHGTDELDKLRLNVRKYLGPSVRVNLAMKPSDGWWIQPVLQKCVRDGFVKRNIQHNAHVTVLRFIKMIRQRYEDQKAKEAASRQTVSQQRRAAADTMSSRHHSDEENQEHLRPA
jgi:hypothetical protein